MSTSNFDFDEEDWFEDDPDPQLPSFTVGLSPRGDEGSSFRLQNDPSAPYQRDTFIERKTAVDIRCSCIDVIHGLWSPDGSAFATLIVLDFRFGGRKRARRVTSADIELRFSGARSDESDPEVVRIAPFGTFHLVPATRTEQLSHSGNVTLGGGTIVTASATAGWEKSTTQEKTDYTTVTGSVDLIGRNWGKKNTCSWTLLENHNSKTGIPNYMRAGILLRRKDEVDFKCFVQVKANVDFKSSFERVFGRTEKDDPVLFNPKFEPTNVLQDYDVKSLGSFDLEKISDLTFATVLTGAIKEKTNVHS